MVAIRGTRPGSAVVYAKADIAASLVADGYAEYVAEKKTKPEGEVKPRASRKRGTTRSTARRTDGQSDG